MRITNVHTHVLEAVLSRPFAYSRAWCDTRAAMVVNRHKRSGTQTFLSLSHSIHLYDDCALLLPQSAHSLRTPRPPRVISSQSALRAD